MRWWPKQHSKLLSHPTKLYTSLLHHVSVPASQKQSRFILITQLGSPTSTRTCPATCVLPKRSKSTDFGTNALPSTQQPLTSSPSFPTFWLTFCSSGFPVWQLDWVFEQAEFTPHLIRWTSAHVSEVGSENLEFVSTRLQGLGMLGCSLEMGRRRWTEGCWCLVPSSGTDLLLALKYSLSFPTYKSGPITFRQSHKQPGSPGVERLETHWVSNILCQLFTLLGCAKLK